MGRVNKRESGSTLDLRWTLLLSRGRFFIQEFSSSLGVIFELHDTVEPRHGVLEKPRIGSTGPLALGRSLARSPALTRLLARSPTPLMGNCEP